MLRVELQRNEDERDPGVDDGAETGKDVSAHSMWRGLGQGDGDGGEEEEHGVDQGDDSDAASGSEGGQRLAARGVCGVQHDAVGTG